MLGVFCLVNCGCSSFFSRPVMSAAPQSLQWFSNLAPSVVEASPAFDLTLIQPASTMGICPNDLLEITIWDLYEPGKPHTFPARVDANGQIAAPHLEAIPVKGMSASEVESQLTENYRQHEVLKQPRVLVRELASAPLPVYVTGAVQRPGLINLPRRSASVFAALISAGGLSRNAGMHVFVSDQTHAKPVEAVQAAVPANQIPADLPLVAGNSGLQLATDNKVDSVPVSGKGNKKNKATRKAETILRFQSEPPPQSAADPDLPELSAGGYSSADTNTISGQTESNALPDSPANQPALEETIVTRPIHDNPDADPTRPGHWYDLSAEQDREKLKRLVLRDGDVITVRTAAPPVRITGVVAQPGPYRTPAGNTMTVVEALELAGGLTVRDKAVAIILTRPASGSRAIQRWTFHMGDGQTLPANAPFVQAGDLIYVEPTAKARVQSVVDALRPSKW